MTAAGFAGIPVDAAEFTVEQRMAEINNRFVCKYFPGVLEKNDFVRYSMVQ